MICSENTSKLFIKYRFDVIPKINNKHVYKQYVAQVNKLILKYQHQEILSTKYFTIY